MRLSNGFTLIEMLVTLSLLTILLSITLPVSELIKQREKESELQRRLLLIRTAIDAYHLAVQEGKIDKSASQSSYPPNLQTLVQGVVDKTSPNGNKIYFLRRMPADPMCVKCEERQPEETWDTRSYQSSHEDFHAGEDVYDIRSKSTKIGINGVPYHDW
ncbi:type II secretion system protein [Aeromonas jandaei]|uniref:type II secretion system protein n=1 Tax=Aeromonas jandaei TaxID=650 RepID=UPI001ABF1143|nr:type II secretion system protein [Aeromonas jandaei]QSR71963.1 type II secretion system protein [Aeromonas jandaei]